ncbi:hypothetical protein C7999DRAFT_36287 [Corynascus novoguineensis]|uniref:Uncharacterized protein n=1 Tax=Corynascus novoguineensis TaxID=1126955 RepID=A0AAN7CJR7_9PEZI|nr:hypothetical protein C7999DRAFT_36287 [Corynascus novoguineensis]
MVLNPQTHGRPEGYRTPTPPSSHYTIGGSSGGMNMFGSEHASSRHASSEHGSSGHGGRASTPSFDPLYDDSGDERWAQRLATSASQASPPRRPFTQSSGTAPSRTSTGPQSQRSGSSASQAAPPHRSSTQSAAPSQKSGASTRTQASASSKPEKQPYGHFGDAKHGIDKKGLTGKPFYWSTKKGRYYYYDKKGEKVYFEVKKR